MKNKKCVLFAQGSKAGTCVSPIVGYISRNLVFKNPREGYRPEESTNPRNLGGGCEYDRVLPESKW